MKTINLAEIELQSGTHSNFEAGACIMEMVSYMADEPWSDRPECACPILTEYAITLNDQFENEYRQKMKEFIPLLIGTRKDNETQIARKRLIRWRYVTVTFPLILDLIGEKEYAEKLRTFQNNLVSMAEAAKYLKDSKIEITKIADAYAYAYANADAYAYASADADTYAYAYADADTYAYANANAYAYAYANANANADTYACLFKKLRDEIVKVSLETLRMAI